MDRYETSDPFIRFSEQQLAEIRKITLSKVLCENSDSIDTIQRQIMDLPDTYLNPRLPCESMPNIDLIHWRERGNSCIVNNRVLAIGRSDRLSPCVNCVCTFEGAKCQSLRITNCNDLFAQYSRQQVLSDSVCKVQCAFTFSQNMRSSQSRRISTIFGFSQ
ncbi:peroxidasin homolog pxn-1-like [Oppia nitens]|uniref:peroxidasin homolog pxn-1-like n=1 Tax=Oppia nitens TaxID=1686743 RepID=UPI0023D9F65F|nr:peroxidasin homolog pxn-1-like [Oppia nitens]